MNTRITVFGATGNIGTRVVASLLEKGYSVRAFVHGTHNFNDHAALTIVQGDIYTPADVAHAIADSDIIISTLGSWGTPKKDVLTTAMKTIIPVMEERTIRRIISLTGNAVINQGETVHLRDRLNRLMLSIIGKKILNDGQQHLDLLRQSHLDWTVLRSPIMNSSEAKGFTLLTESPAPWRQISRDDVAAAVVAMVDSDEYIQKAPFLDSGK